MVTWRSGFTQAHVAVWSPEVLQIDGVCHAVIYESHDVRSCEVVMGHWGHVTSPLSSMMSKK